MATEQNGEIYLDHEAQDIDDNIDEVEAARGTYESLGDALAALRTAINALNKSIKYNGEVEHYNDLPQNPNEGDAYKVLYKGDTGQQPLSLVYFWGDDGNGTKSWVSFDSVDYYSKNNIDAIISNLSSSLRQQINAVKDQVSNMSFTEMSQADYDALEQKSSTTVYYVRDESGRVTQYIGDAKLSSGAGTIGTASVAANGGMHYTIGIAVKGEME